MLLKLSPEQFKILSELLQSNKNVDTLQWCKNLVNLIKILSSILILGLMIIQATKYGIIFKTSRAHLKVNVYLLN